MRFVQGRLRVGFQSCFTSKPAALTTLVSVDTGRQKGTCEQMGLATTPPDERFVGGRVRDAKIQFSTDMYKVPLNTLLAMECLVPCVNIRIVSNLRKSQPLTSTSRRLTKILVQIPIVGNTAIFSFCMHNYNRGNGSAQFSFHNPRSCSRHAQTRGSSAHTNTSGNSASITSYCQQQCSNCSLAYMEIDK